ncbi:MAG: TrkH family potassium uptake protein, partial [Parvularcula sp.]|nr:TrkH family potassium uptake protein [Parvularcula sp.]
DLPPPLLLGILYGGLISVGALLLRLPLSVTDPGTVSWSDAFFMATSAVTVTGLVVIDPGTQLTHFGQGVVMVLIQLGGLGLMSTAVLFMMSLGIPVGFVEKSFLEQDLGQNSISRLLSLVWLIFRVVLIAVLLGTIALAFVFVPAFGWGEGVWQALFHAVSAFNNAGFALFPDSLTGFDTNPFVVMVVTTLIIVGGLGFVVLYELKRQRHWRSLSLHTKMMLFGTAALLIAGFFGFLALEWSNPNTLGGRSLGDRLLLAWFHGVTPRTAGFNTLDMAAVGDGTSLFTIVLMIIGGGPTSTAGGIKVTTFLTAVLATAAFFRREERPALFGYAINLEQVLRALAVMTISGGTVILALFLLTVSEDIAFMPLLFETASAFGTVGLSQGATGELSEAGRLVICLLMFIGRVGPLTLGFFIAAKLPPRVRYPSGTIYIG